jgi:hypothetical protein
MRSFLTILMALCAAGTAAAKALPRDHSWGKPDVTFLQYRTDAVECAWQASQAPPVVNGTNMVMPQPPSPVPGVGPTADDVLSDLVDAYNVNKLIVKSKVIDQLQGGLEACLTARGYRPFGLTKAQAEELHAMKPGDKARQLYLYRLSVDPDVLKAQGLAR